MALKGSSARRYAKALFAIGEEKGGLEEFGTQLSALAGVFAGNGELAEVFKSPVFGDDAKLNILTKLLAKLVKNATVKSFCLLRWKKTASTNCQPYRQRSRT